MDDHKTTKAIVFRGGRFAPRAARLRLPISVGRDLREIWRSNLRSYSAADSKLVRYTGISYEFIRRLMVIDLGPADRNSLAMSCKAFMRDAFYLCVGSGSRYIPLMSRRDLARVPAPEYDNWLAVYEKEVIKQNLVHCIDCRILHDPRRVYLAQDNTSVNHPPSWSRYLCVQRMLHLASDCAFDSRFHPLILYFIYRVKLEDESFDETHALEATVLDRTLSQQPASWNMVDPFVYTLKQDAKIKSEGIFLRQRKTLILPKPTGNFWKRTEICRHYHYDIFSNGNQPFRTSERKPLIMGGNYAVAVGVENVAIPTPFDLRNDESALLQPDHVNVHSNVPPFNYLYNCSICNKDWMLEPISPYTVATNAGIQDMCAGLMITSWSCVAWYQKHPDGSRPRITPAQVYSAFTSPHDRELTNSMQGLYPGTAATLFEGWARTLGP